ncbi:MAG TPA: cupin domain-containing protein [Candidatus Baltobacteraceae bacterium]|jgi:quercetin dioxygenase-like cupin family protein
MFFRCFVFLSAFALTSAAAFAAGTGPTIVTPSQVQWQAGTGSMAGAQVAIIAGDPSKAGEYTMRLKMADGTKFPPHFHGDVENVTVLSGTLMVGTGDTMNQSKMIALPAGSFVSVPKGLHHYAMAKGETVIQIHGVGPSSMTMVGGTPH